MLHTVHVSFDGVSIIIYNEKVNNSKNNDIKKPMHPSNWIFDSDELSKQLFFFVRD